MIVYIIFIVIIDDGDHDVDQWANQVLDRDLSISLFVDIYIYIYIYMSMHFSLSLSIYIYIYICVSIYLSLYISIYLSIALSLSLSLCIYIYIYIYIQSRSRSAVLDQDGHDPSSHLVVAVRAHVHVLTTSMLVVLSFVSSDSINIVFRIVIKQYNYHVPTTYIT